MPTKILPLLVFLLPLLLQAQVKFPDNGRVFNDTLVPSIFITIDGGNLQSILEETLNNVDYPATFTFDDGIAPPTTIENIGFRLRGNTSLLSGKKSFKVSFNSFVSGQKFEGLEKLNLNGEHNDPSVMRSKICWDVLRHLEVPAPRANHIALYINNQYYGLYANIEHIDEEFVQSRFTNGSGNLYKCTYPANMDYEGNTAADFESAGYALQQSGTNAWADVVAFTQTLNQTPEEELFCDIREVFNLEAYLKCAAFEVMCGHWDAPLYNPNNFYLYHNPYTQQLEYIPYDLDNTLGTDWFNIDWSQRNIYNWDADWKASPMFEKIVSVPEFRAIYNFYIEKISTLFKDETFLAKIETRKELIASYVASDPFYSLDYGFDDNDFENCFYQEVANHQPIGIFPYLSQRSNSAANQLDANYNLAPILSFADVSQPLAGELLPVQIQITDKSDISQAYLQYRFDGGNWQNTDLYDTGNSNDKNPNDGIYGNYVAVPENATSFEYRFEIKNTQNLWAYLPCDYAGFAVLSSNYGLVINEWMPSNSSTIANEAGEYADWLEIVNISGNNIDLNGLYLTDNFAIPDKWTLPNYSISPQEHILIWADEMGELGAWHANFKLNADGEELAIMGQDENGWFPIDKQVWSNAQTDESFGRLPNGTGVVQILPWASPGENNENAAGLTHVAPTNQIQVFPNPVQEFFTLKQITNNTEKLSTVALINSQANVVSLWQNPLADQVYVIPQNLPKGIYWLRITNEAQQLQTLALTIL